MREEKVSGEEGVLSNLRRPLDEGPFLSVRREAGRPLEPTLISVRTYCIPLTEWTYRGLVSVSKIELFSQIPCYFFTAKYRNEFGRFMKNRERAPFY